jgi:dienelactone hydrolase
MGLFTLMAPPPGSAPAAFLHPEAGYDVQLQPSVSGQVVATATTRRQGPAAVGVVEKELRPASGGIYANLYLPKHTAGRRPAVLAFGGSDGGLTTSFAAALLAAHGYPSLALAYFKAPGLPEDLHNIPLEYFTRALRALRAQPGVDPRHVLVSGGSRGSEAALLLGAHFPQLVNGVIAGVPSSVVNPGWPDTSQPAWTLDGRPLPAVSPSEFGQPNPPGKPQTIIPVERIRGPILLTCGELDRVGRPVATATPSPRALVLPYGSSCVVVMRRRSAGRGRRVGEEAGRGRPWCSASRTGRRSAHSGPGRPAAGVRPRGGR